MFQGEFSAPAWLFSFVDLAFLMLIAMTQLGDMRGYDLDLGEIVVPRIQSQEALSLPRDARALLLRRRRTRAQE